LNTGKSQFTQAFVSGVAPHHHSHTNYSAVQILKEVSALLYGMHNIPRRTLSEVIMITVRYDRSTAHHPSHLSPFRLTKRVPGGGRLAYSVSTVPSSCGTVGTYHYDRARSYQCGLLGFCVPSVLGFDGKKRACTCDGQAAQILTIDAYTN
jgi:hypothetical protein